MPDLLTGKRLGWLWNTQKATIGERTLAALAASLRAFGFDGLEVKCFDRARWMGAFGQGADFDLPPLASWDAYRVWRDRIHAEGLLFVVTAVVHGEDGVWEREAALLAHAIAQGADAVILDVEPSTYGPYWAPHHRNADSLARALRAAADKRGPEYVLGIAPPAQKGAQDPFGPGGPGRVPLTPWLQGLASDRAPVVICPQTYWPDFGLGARAALADLRVRLTRGDRATATADRAASTDWSPSSDLLLDYTDDVLRGARVHPYFPGTADAVGQEIARQWVEDHWIQSWTLFRVGHDLHGWEHVVPAAPPVAPPAPPPPAPLIIVDGADLKAAVEDLRRRTGALEARAAIQTDFSTGAHRDLERIRRGLAAAAGPDPA